MTSVLTNRSIKFKLFLAVLLPLIGFTVFGIGHINDNYQLQQQMRYLNNQTQLAQYNSALVHELQKERGMSAGYLGSSGKAFADKLPGQRKLTDQALQRLNEFLASADISQHNRQLMASINQQLQKRTEIRNQVDALKIGLGGAVGYYTGLNGRLLGVIDAIANEATQPNLIRQAIAFSSFLQFKERAGIERAVLSNTFAKDRFSPQLFRRFVSLLAEQQAYLASYRAYATPEHSAFLDQTLVGKDVDEVERLRKLALERGLEGGFGVNPTHWFQVKTARINLLKKVDDHLSAQLLGLNQRLIDQASSGLYQALAVVCIPLLLTLVLSFWITRLLHDNLARIQTAVSRVAQQYDLTQHSPVEGQDELGQLSSAFNTLVDNFNRIITKVNHACNQVHDASRQTSEVGSSVVADVENGFQQTEMVATAMNEMAATVQEITQNAVKAADATRAANEQAKHGDLEVEKTVSMIGTLAEELQTASRIIQKVRENSNEVGGFIETVESISERTNLLALNAAIEAARAGEAGRGFAVVADEVRSLSIQTKDSTQEIAQMTTRLQEEAQKAVEAMERGMQLVENSVAEINSAREDLNRIVENAETQAQMNEQIATASEEQAAVAENINKNIIHIRDIYEQTRSNSGHLQEAGRRLSDLSQALESEIERFKVH